MTPAEQIAAEVAARYRCTVNPDVVQIIPRGVSAFDYGENTNGTLREQINASFKASVLHRQRLARLAQADAIREKAEQKARSAKEKAAKVPLAVPADREEIVVPSISARSAIQSLFDECRNLGGGSDMAGHFRPEFSKLVTTKPAPPTQETFL